ncbi:MAG: stage 0 sporulation family protein [Candidatus Omnitrophica bacterium]|nr:stage 0 sporulation family protein [Candidatus Omnitrophota bacterium]
MIEVVKIQLRDAGKIVYYNPRGLKFKIGEGLIIESDRGVDYGVVISEVEQLDNAKIEQPLKSVIRVADEKDHEKIKANKEKAREAIDTCYQKVQQHNLPMKLVDAEYSFDLSKLIFYFTSEGRVDFRELVKELASIFKVRIELRQIGVRDEAKMFGGVGHCGRELCCTSFLRDFEPVTIKMAKEQNLSLNPTKISGVCGRLMCCLGYENETYKECAKTLPRNGDRVKTRDGKEGKIIEVNILKRKALIVIDDKSFWIDFAECKCPDKKCVIHSKYSFKGRKKKGDEVEESEEIDGGIPEEE